MDGNERIEYVKAAIADISRQLREPMSNIERAVLMVDRKDFREELARLEDAASERREMKP